MNPKQYGSCICCGVQFTSGKKTRLFLQGHDAKLKSNLRAILDGDESIRSLRNEILLSIDKMKFLSTNEMSEIRELMLDEKKRRGL